MCFVRLEDIHKVQKQLIRLHGNMSQKDFVSVGVYVFALCVLKIESEKESVCERERECVCVCERERESVCV